jgi:hypothetical protein
MFYPAKNIQKFLPQKNFHLLRNPTNGSSSIILVAFSSSRVVEAASFKDDSSKVESSEAASSKVDSSEVSSSEITFSVEAAHSEVNKEFTQLLFQIATGL